MSEAISSSIDRPGRKLRQWLNTGVIASALIIVGAALALFAVVADYYRDSDNAIGRTQLLLLFAGLAVMCGGVAMRVRNPCRRFRTSLLGW